MRETVTRVTQNMVLGARQSKWVAEQIGKPYPTMMRELNPYDQSAKLGADTLLDIMRATKDITALEFMAKELGYELNPVQLELDHPFADE